MKHLKHRGKKLTDEAVIEIMLDKVSSAKEMAAKHGVGKTQIYAIHQGLMWKHISCDPQYTRRDFKQERKKLNLDIVTKIKNNEITDLKAVAEQYGVRLKYLWRLRDPNYIGSWKTIPVKGHVPLKKWRKKLTTEEVIGIYCDRTSSNPVLAKKYNVHHKTISEIRNGRRRTEITSKLAA